MERTDKSRFLLYIEPRSNDKLISPVNDVFTYIMERALEESERGTADYSDLTSNGTFYPGKTWFGYHETDCGECCNGCDYLLKNGMITNSLATFYLQYNRNSIPKSELNKVIQLFLFYKLERYQKHISFIIEHNPILLWIMRIRFKIVSLGIPQYGTSLSDQFDLDFIDDEEDQIMY